ncbi:MAG: M23 family metallopeptidase, partial [Luteolibacter sp.]
MRVIFALLVASALGHAAVDLRLPTENHHLFSDEPERFYMYVDRIFEGEVSRPGQGGAFGFTRTARRVNGQVILSKFHEGIDIAPLYRDAAGEPLDLVTSIADGRVVHVSASPGRSNYGRYLVVEHDWEASKIYSLYAHLAEITCHPGDPVRAGSVLGRMGYSGVGLNRTRAHLHLELAMMSSSRFGDWFQRYGGGINHHGLFNGMNLIGTDVARYFIEHRKAPQMRFSQLVMSTEVYFKVLVADDRIPDFVQRHPWILRGEPAGVRSWEIALSATGQPVSFTPRQDSVEAMTVTMVRPSEIPHHYLTRGLVQGVGNQASLTGRGRQLIELLMGHFPGAENQSADTEKPPGQG